MSNTFKIALAAAVAVVVAALAVGLYFNQPGLVGGPQPTATPTAGPTPTAQAEQPTATPTVAPTASPTTAGSPASFARFDHGDGLPGGTYVTDGDFPLNVTFTLPSGWEKWSPSSDAAGVWKRDGRAPSGAGLGFFIVDTVYADPCHWEGTETVSGPHADDLAQALANLPGFQSTEPAEVTLAGYQGSYIELTAPDDFAECDLGQARTFKSPLGGYRFFDQPNEHERLWILQLTWDRLATTGKRLVVLASDFPETPESDLAEIEQILESIQIEEP
ncbi:MAG: hypothetical protein M3N29_07475 [Chloroflexota bacterium]|nr:hypothetical protein [Chloroflexota bacterium]